MVCITYAYFNYAKQVERYCNICYCIMVILTLNSCYVVLV